MRRKNQKKDDFNLGFESITDPNEIVSTDNNVDVDSLYMDDYFNEVGMGGSADKDRSDNNDGVNKADQDGDNDLSEEEIIKQVANLKKELESVKTRYASSDDEGKRLNVRNKELELYAPLIDKMRNDPGLVKTIKGYLGVDDGPKNIIPKIAVPEDFIFDMDEAIKDPNSQSAGFLSEIIRSAVSGEVSALRRDLSEREAVNARSQMESQQRKELMDEFKISEKDVEDLVDWAKSQPFTLKDIYYLKTRQSRDKEIIDRTSRELIERANRVNKTQRSLASLETGDDKKDAKGELDRLFSAIENATGSRSFG